MASFRDAQRRIKALKATAEEGSGATPAERQTAKRLIRKLEVQTKTQTPAGSSLPRTVQAQEVPEHRILREVLRHYNEFKALVQQDGRNHVIEHGYYVDNGDGTKRKVSVSISFWDLQEGIRELAPRKKEAIFWNVILDKKQKDVAKEMRITTVSVGQYVEAGMQQLAKRYFAETRTEEIPLTLEDGNG